MRVVFAVLSVLAGLAGTAFALSYFLLPVASESARSIEIDRPASTVFPLIANLRTFNEYSPWFDRDPKADYTFEGPAEGAGQMARWESSIPALGRGDATIVKTLDDREADIRLRLGSDSLPFAPPPTALLKIALSPGARGVTATWTLMSACSPEPIAAPCRALSVLGQWGMAAQLDRALVRLKQLAEQLPALDIADLKPETEALTAQPFAYIESAPAHGAAPFRDLLRQSFSAVDAYLKQNALTGAGAPMALAVRGADGQARVRAGRAFAAAAPPGQSETVKIGRTPAGRVLKLLYVGDYEQITPTYAKLDAYVRAHRLKPAGEPWEVYLDDPRTTQPAQLRTEIYLPIEAGR